MMASITQMWASAWIGKAKIEKIVLITKVTGTIFFYSLECGIRTQSPLERGGTK
jgi:hypothetical protein